MSQTTAYVPDLQTLSGAQAVKAPSKTTKDKVGDDDADQLGKKTAKSRAKKPPARKSNDSDNESAEADSDDEDTEELTKGGQKPSAGTKSKESEKVNVNQKKGSKGGKRPPPKRKSVDGDDEPDGSGSGSDDDGNRDQKKVMKGKESNVEKIAKKKTQTVQTRKQPKRTM